MRYIALIRAINVGGHRKVKMKDLREMFIEMGIEQVRTYIQSGNVIFNSDITDAHALSREIENEIRKAFGHEVIVIIRTPEQLHYLIENNPFARKNHQPYMLYVTFFKHDVSPEKQEEIRNLTNDIEMYRFQKGELFSLIDKQTEQKVYFSNNYIENIAGQLGTTRNWNSVNKIYELAKVSTA